ncbi:DoxX family membrane protein [Glycomyces buryatensis]|uniref:DoxX family membrane protein n=1 Tax=Glycomyces buryatensis TaxID=2570927 RepID=UPI001B3C1679|nr:DoxX family membrane protein [Glycomyces buryatensis]
MSTAAHQVFWLLRIGFTIAPILAGVDKFFNWSVQWPDYLAGWIRDLLPGTGQDFMYVVGGIEILAGLLVLFAPRVGALIVAAWLGGIIVNLLTANPPQFYDIALRDVGLMLGALALWRLALAVVPARRDRTLPARPW